MSPFDLSRILLVGGGLLVPYSLSGSPVIKQFRQMVTMVPGQGGAVSISVLLLTTPPLEISYQDTSWELGRRSLSSVISSFCAWV